MMINFVLIQPERLSSNFTEGKKMFWLGLVIKLFVGGSIGFVVMDFS